MTDTDLRALLPLGPPRTEGAVDPRPRRLALLAVGAGISLDIGIRGGPSNLAVSVGLVLAAVALSTDGRIVQREARLLVAAATLPALLLAVRSSGWLAASNLVAACTLAGLGLLLARSGSVLDVTPRRLLRRTWPALGRGLSINQVLRPVVPAVPARTSSSRLPSASTETIRATRASASSSPTTTCPPTVRSRPGRTSAARAQSRCPFVMSMKSTAMS